MLNFKKKLDMLLSTDQPGRVAAVFIFAPLLLFKGIQYNDMFISFFGLLLYLWDLYWLILRDPMHSM